MTFAQAEGAEPLPSQLVLKEMSTELRAILWKIIYDSFEACEKSDSFGYSHAGEPWLSILRAKHVYRDHKPADTFDTQAKGLIKGLKSIFMDGTYVEVFDFLEWLLTNFQRPVIKPQTLQWALTHCRAAYRVVDNCIIVPVSNEAEGETLQRAFADVSVSEFSGAQAHLRNAARLLTAGKWADSIRESVHSVEGVARVILRRPRVTLGDALKEIEKSHKLHPALRDGFGKLYGFTSDESGIRHALIDDANAKVDEADAIFMLGACASFVSYLIARHQEQLAQA